MTDFLYVDRDDRLRALCVDLASAEWLAVDTEFLRERTYYPRLCLIQIASAQRVACIDPLRLNDLAPLARLLAEPRILKILHAARQDVEVLAQRLNVVPRPIFDTQIAATLVGYGEQIGYGALVAEIAGVTLAKAHTRTDWSRRPLPPDALAYAADDVRYLGPLYDDLARRLDSAGRRDWLDADAAILADPAVYLPDPDTSFLRVRGQQALDGAARGLLQALAAWRERRAMAKDRPRQWILADATLLELAREAPRTPEALQAIAGTEGVVRAGLEQELIDLIDAGYATLPSAPHEPLTAEERRRLKALTARLRARGKEIGVSPALLANRRQLEQLVRGERDLPVLRGWRRDAVGELLVEFVEEAEAGTEVGEA